MFLLKIPRYTIHIGYTRVLFTVDEYVLYYDYCYGWLNNISYNYVNVL